MLRNGMMQLLRLEQAVFVNGSHFITLIILNNRNYSGGLKKKGHLKYQRLFPTPRLLCSFSVAEMRGSSIVDAGTRSAKPLAGWCRSSLVTKWLFLCAAALTDILHCTVYSPNSRKLPCGVQRPARAGAER